MRSPLTHIQSYLEMLAEYDLTDAERKDIKARLLQSTRGTLDMVNNVLHWSISQLRGGEIKKESFIIADALANQLALFQAIAGRKHIMLDSGFAQDTTIHGNGDMIQLIVRNLLNNAIKFTAPGGHITLSASCYDDTCLISVKDSGNGKPSKLTDAIFQLSSNTTVGTANESGVGLGLALCREYTGLMGGRIWFSSDDSSGTTFYVELPANPR